MSEQAVHRIHVQGRVTAVRERIERVLNIDTSVEPEPGGWTIRFVAPKNVSLDFLRPDVLPPRDS